MKYVPARRLFAGIMGLAVAAGIAAVVTNGPAPRTASASSHREAPLIAEDPTADNTDLYAFRDAANPDRINIISNWIPGEDTAAGPNYHTFSPTARYSIKIDNNGDARPDIQYRFQFAKPATLLFLRKTVQSYTVTKIVGRTTTVTRGFRTAPNYVGPRANSASGTGNCDAACYRRQAARAIKSLPSRERIFAGQRDDAFFGDIGAVFDDLAFRRGTGVTGGGKDFFAGYGVHTISIQVPINRVTRPGKPTIGIWSTTERQKVVVNRRTGRAATRWVQVSRIGNPLFNEVVVPTTAKDAWNAGNPINDRAYFRYTQRPMLAAAINLFYPGVIDAPEKNRSDLSAIFLTGLPKLNYTGAVKADMLRLNTSIAPATSPNRLSVLAGDTAGWPNGRRLGDDVIDIAVQAVAGATFTPANPKSALLGDGVDGDDRPLLDVFPYQADPRSGFENPKGETKP